ncbi:MAG: biotin-dependent carboxyltransferase family protein [Candidatus Eremiobacteraeota bacterium]|nr:biotin-dependent carboxyltransferase family protein [Candidatus Eremiobacteraeota bacterium]
MSGRLRVLSAGPGETIQDAGRYGYLRYGVVASGPMDWIAYEILNRALENPRDAAAIEISRAGIAVACEAAPLVVAFGGGGFIWERSGARLSTAGIVRLEPGEHLRARAGSSWGNWTYLAIAGGIDVPRVLGSRSTYARFAIGGIEGRALRAGDALAACASDAQPQTGALLTPLLERPKGSIRVVLGPQDDYFTDEARATFFTQAYTISTRFDRMGYWLEGPRITHSGGFDIVSDGIPLGAIQVPGAGQPLVLMADHQATGGYPKLGTVARADIGAFAQHRPGENVRFEACTVDAARRALLDVYASLERPLSRASDEALASSNLIGGVISATD